MNDNVPEENSAEIKEDTENSKSIDSFNKELQKIYQEHKKGETKVPHRPTSSYTSNRNFNQANKEIDAEKKIKNKPQSAQAGKSNNNSKNSNNKDQNKNKTDADNNIDSNINNNDLTLEDILNDLNNFLMAHKIKKSDFIDNPSVFLTFEDFVDVFKQIHYTLPKKYLKLLFDYNNPEGAKENYILMSKFIKNLTFYKIEGIGNDSDYSKFERNNFGISQSNSSVSNQIMDNKTLTEGFDKKSNKSIYELKYINEEYSQFNKDIINILKNSKKKNIPNNRLFNQNYNFNFNMNKWGSKGKNLSSSKITIESKPKMNNYNLFNVDDSKTRQMEREKELISDLLDSKKNENAKNTEEKNRYDISQILKNMELEEAKEEKFIRNQFDKRDKQSLKDYAYKCEECNRICTLLNIGKNYSLSMEDEIKCKVEEEGRGEYCISLKELKIEWRRLYKQYHQKEILELYKEKEDTNKNKNVELILNERKKEKEEKHREIKEVLIEAVRLKTKLKSQLDDLKSNIKIDEKVVLEHLRRAGMDIPNINISEKNVNKNNKKEGKEKNKNKI